MGCKAVPSPEEFEKYLADSKALRVAVQICLPDKTAYFDKLTVDVTDLPANLSEKQLRELFQDAIAYKAGEDGFTNPYQSSSPVREYQTTRLWRKPSNPSDYPQDFIGIGVTADTLGVKSDGSGTGYLIDSTEKDQPVFYSFTHKRLNDVVALHVTPPAGNSGSSAYRTFWFKPPKVIEHDKYSAWIDPVSEEGPSERSSAKFDTGWLLTHGKQMPIYKVGENAPRIRYILMNDAEFEKSRPNGRRAINSAMLKHMKDYPSDNEYYHYVPEKHDSIPRCDI